MAKLKQIIPVVLFSAAVLGSACFSTKSADEVVLAATDVGTPTGDAVVKRIGPEGGTVASPDGRITLTVPKNALNESVEFSIQPITNKAGGGFGSAYRLLPSGKTFTTPLELSVRYNDSDLDGTIPEALSLAYQDAGGSWHVESGKVDDAAKSLKTPIKHFTDFAPLSGLRVTPARATVRVGKAQVIELQVCKEKGFFDNLLSKPLNCAQPPRVVEGAWKLEGPGTLIESKLAREEGLITVTYKAPAKRPKPNTAEVKVSVRYSLTNPETGERTEIDRTFVSKITIVSAGFTASGKDGPTTYSGGVCGLDEPFTIFATNSFLHYPINFVPSGGAGGSFNYNTSMGPLTMSGSGAYTVEDIYSDKPRIVGNANTTLEAAGRSSGGTGAIHIDLVPMEEDTCD